MHNIIKSKLVPAVAALALLGGGFTAYAQDPAPASPPPGDSARSVLPGEAVPLPEVQTSGNVSFVSGGATYEQIPAFNQARSQFPLNIEVYQREGAKNAFTADADVKLVEAKSGDVVLETKTDGPFLWAKVPPGSYKLTTTLAGVTKESRVNVAGSRPTRAIVVFPQGTSQ